MSHPLDHPITCPKCKTEDVAPSHYDDGPNGTLYTPMWLCHGCLKIIEVEDVQNKLENNIDLLRHS